MAGRGPGNHPPPRRPVVRLFAHGPAQPPRGPARPPACAARRATGGTPRRTSGRDARRGREKALRERACSSDDRIVPSTRRRDSAFAVIVHGQRVLLVRARGRRRWQLPGGGLKRRETPLEGLHREVDEETGLTPQVRALVGAYPRSDGSFALVYLARVDLRGQDHGPGGEIARLRWASPRKARRLLTRRARARLRDALDCHAGRRRPAVRGIRPAGQHAQAVARVLRAATSH